MAEEFEVKVLFTGFDDQLLKDWAKETKFAADAMLTVVGTMETQIAALNSIKGELKTIADAFTAGGGGGPAVGGGSDPHLVSAIRDLSAVIRDNKNIGYGIAAAGKGQGGGGSGGGGMTFDEEAKSFNPITLENTKFGLQDFERQAARAAEWLGNRRAKNRLHWTDPNSGEKMHATKKQLDKLYSNWEDEGADFENVDPLMQSYWDTPKTNVTEDNLLLGLGAPYQKGISPWWNLHKVAKQQAYFQPGGLFNYKSYVTAAQNIGDVLTAPGAYQTIAGGHQFQYNPFSADNRGFFSSTYQQLGNTWLGLNPRENWQTGGEIKTNVAEMGYTGDEHSRIVDLTSDLFQNHGWDPKTAASYIDKSYRWGYAPLDELRKQMMDEIPKAANTARMGLKEFTAEMLTAAQAMSASGARNNFQANQLTIQGANYVGMSPGQTAATIDNPTATWLGTGYLASQGDKYPLLHATSGPSALYADMKGLGSVVFGALGVQNGGQLNRLLKEGGPRAMAARQTYAMLTMDPTMGPLLAGRPIDQFAEQMSLADTDLKAGTTVDALLSGGLGDNANPLYSFAEREKQEKLLKSQLNGPNGAQAQRELNRLQAMDSSRTDATSLIWSRAKDMGLSGKDASDWAHKIAGDVMKDGHWEADHTPKQMLTSLQSAITNDAKARTQAVSQGNTKLDVSISLDPAFDRLVNKLTYSLDNTPDGTASHSDQRHTYTIRAGQGWGK